MQASVVIPVWNGESVIRACLQAVFSCATDHLLEVICVDNASQDESAALIADQFPQVRLLPQPVNLGFAGGVNAGMKVARADIFVLLNQDCLVQEDWLQSLLTACEVYPECGIAGATVLNADGSVNHAGARLQYPLAYGEHLTAAPEATTPYPVEYVTGAVFAIRRETWSATGPFDEAFYPAYFEETDYCFRARKRGWQTFYVPQAQARHLFSNEEWQADPIKHAANQHAARYRFIAKHFDSEKLAAFFAAEMEDSRDESFFDQATGRTIAARQTLRNLPQILESRQRDLSQIASNSHRRQLTVGFTRILRRSFQAAEIIVTSHPTGLAHEWGEAWQTTVARLEELRQQEHALLARIYLRHPLDKTPESKWQRLVRLGIRRPLNFITGRDYLLLAELNTVHVARMDQMNRLHHLLQNRLSLLEILSDYDYR